MTLSQRLDNFAKQNKIHEKGPLCVALVVTRHAKKDGLPLDSSRLLTEGAGQVKGLGKSAVQSILKEHGITKVLAEEGGRTSRGSVGNMQKYVAFLNDLHEENLANLDLIEEFWIEKVRTFFIGKPFVLKFDTSKSLKAVIKDLLSQVVKRQEKSHGATFIGTVLQHLVGAKLNVLLDKEIEHHGASVADESSHRKADFSIEDVAIHVTAAPSEAVIRKCASNLNKGLRPMIITNHRGVNVAEGLAEQLEVNERIDIFEIEQFLAGNIYELGKFEQKGRRITAEQLIAEYNKIVTSCETDPSLRIEMLN